MPYYPNGRVQEGYRNRLVLTELMEGLIVLRLWSLPAANRGIFRRTISYATFALSAVFAGLLLSRHDLVIASVPNPLTDGAALLIGRLKGSRIVLELRDIYSDSLIALGKSPSSLLFRAVEAYFRWILNHIDLVAVCGNWMIPRLMDMGISERRILKLFHGTESEYIDAADPEKFQEALQLKNRFVAFYAGSFSSHYDVPNLVRAARILKQNRKSFRLVLIGTGPDASRVAEMVVEWKLDNVFLVGAVAPREVYSYLQAADLCLAPCGYRSMWIHDYLDTKACEYLMAGKPILAIEDHPLLGRLIAEANAGRSVPTRNPESLAREIVFFIDHPVQTVLYGKNARKYAWKNLRREQIVSDFDVELKRKLSTLAL